MFFVVLCLEAPEGSTGCGSDFKASQKTGPWLKVSSDRLIDAGNSMTYSLHHGCHVTQLPLVNNPLKSCKLKIIIIDTNNHNFKAGSCTVRKSFRATKDQATCRSFAASLYKVCLLMKHEPTKC